jgi:hypothetical protein
VAAVIERTLRRVDRCRVHALLRRADLDASGVTSAVNSVEVRGDADASVTEHCACEVDRL